MDGGDGDFNSNVEMNRRMGGGSNNRSPLQAVAAKSGGKKKSSKTTPPWRGGDVGAWIKGKKVVFTLGGERFGLPLRRNDTSSSMTTPASPFMLPYEENGA